MSLPVRVLIVEDSAVVRRLLEATAGTDPRLEVLAAVPSAEEALAHLERTQPDVISMDVFLPGMNGLEAVREIMHRRPTPVVVLSAAARDADLRLSVRALEAGALAALEKPAGPGDPRARNWCDQLVLMSQVSVVRQRRRHRGAAAPRALEPAAAPRLAGLVASTGGPRALAAILGALPGDLALPLLVVQHIPAAFLESFAGWLDELTALEVRVAREGERPGPGCVRVAPADRHLAVDASGRLRLRDGEEVDHHKPSGTVLLASMARALGPRAVGVLLTGMGRDGAEGLREIRRRGGRTIAEDASTAVVHGMPRAAGELGAVEEFLPCDRIAERLQALAGMRSGAARRSAR